MTYAYKMCDPIPASLWNNYGHDKCSNSINPPVFYKCSSTNFPREAWYNTHSIWVSAGKDIALSTFDAIEHDTH